MNDLFSKNKKEQLLVLKNPLFNITLTQLLTYNAHFFGHKKKRNNTNIDYIFSTPKNIDIINLQKTITILRTILPLISDIVYKKGKVATILNTHTLNDAAYLYELSFDINQQFLPMWIPGILSNFKTLRKQKKRKKIYKLKYIPNFIIFLTTFHIKELKSEILPCNIPCAVIQNIALKNLKFLYTIPLDYKKTSLQLLLCQLVVNSIIIGYNKRILYFTKKKFKLKK